MTPPLLAFEHCTVRYLGRVLFTDLSLRIEAGQHWGILGPSGAGKSRLNSVLNGDNPQAYGKDITLFDRRRGTGESIWDISSKSSATYRPSCFSISLASSAPGRWSKPALATGWCRPPSASGPPGGCARSA